MVEKCQNVITLRKKKKHVLKIKYQFYFVEDPVYNDEKLCIFTNTEQQKKTRDLFDHFSHRDYFHYLLEDKLVPLLESVLFNLYLAAAFLLLVSIGTVYTFNFLDHQELNFIPVLLIFTVSGSIIYLALNWIRYSVLKGFINSNFRIDKEFLKILVLKYFCENEDLNDTLSIASLDDYKPLKMDKAV